MYPHRMKYSQRQTGALPRSRTHDGAREDKKMMRRFDGAHCNDSDDVCVGVVVDASNPKGVLQRTSVLPSSPLSHPSPPVRRCRLRRPAASHKTKNKNRKTAATPSPYLTPYLSHSAADFRLHVSHFTKGPPLRRHQQSLSDLLTATHTRAESVASTSWTR